jgi:transcriptional regulator with GAF, ATPase, and Fis domain
MSGEDQATTVSHVRDVGAASGPPARLVAVYPPDVTWSLTLGERPVVVGRDPGAGGAVLAHRTVSRRHGEIGWDRETRRHVVVDLGSHNGVRLDGQPVMPGTAQPLGPSGVLRLGDVLLVHERHAGLAMEDARVVSHESVPGASGAARALRAAIARAAPDPSPVLIVGETGTGKEWIAGELHRLSGRGGPMVAINCAALASQLVESQLFGHVRGAFTGASSDAPGVFRAAHGGTLFLDEIGELPVELQPKLLRVLQDGRVTAVGSTASVAVDVRVIAATNRPLDVEVEAGRFRRDLHARLALWTIEVPPLRERRSDLLAWVQRLHALWHARRGGAAPPLELGPDAAERLLGHPWLDNLRGVDRLIHALGPVSGERWVQVADLPAWLIAASAPPVVVASSPSFVSSTGTLPTLRAEEARVRRPSPTREELIAAMDRTGGSVRAMARQFGRDRRQIYRWLEAHGLRRAGDSEDADGDASDDDA